MARICDECQRPIAPGQHYFCEASEMREVERCEPCWEKPSPCLLCDGPCSRRDRAYPTSEDSFWDAVDGPNGQVRVHRRCTIALLSAFAHAPMLLNLLRRPAAQTELVEVEP